jgi:hypothetical protein
MFYTTILGALLVFIQWYIFNWAWLQIDSCSILAVKFFVTAYSPNDYAIAYHATNDQVHFCTLVTNEKKIDTLYYNPLRTNKCCIEQQGNVTSGILVFVLDTFGLMISVILLLKQWHDVQESLYNGQVEENEIPIHRININPDDSNIVYGKYEHNDDNNHRHSSCLIIQPN